MASVGDWKGVYDSTNIGTQLSDYQYAYIEFKLGHCVSSVVRSEQFSPACEGLPSVSVMALSLLDEAGVHPEQTSHPNVLVQECSLR